jgi:hypothetical protein
MERRRLLSALFIVEKVLQKNCFCYDDRYKKVILSCSFSVYVSFFFVVNQSLSIWDILFSLIYHRLWAIYVRRSQKILCSFFPSSA